MAANVAGLVEANLAFADHEFAQPLARAQKARFDRGKAQAVCVCKCLLLNTVDIALLEDLAISGGQFRQHSRQTFR